MAVAEGATQVLLPVAGRWRSCLAAEAARRRIQEGANWQQIDAEATRCATGSLTPEGTLELSLDPD